jgi:hypothetical protein
MLQVAKKDLERLRHVRLILPRLVDSDLPPRVARGMAHRPSFPDALTWLEMFGDAPEAVERWHQARAQRLAETAAPDGPDGSESPDEPNGNVLPDRPARRRRRRRRGRRRGPEQPS